MVWVSTVYTPISDLDSVMISHLAGRRGLHETSSEPSKWPTYIQMLPAERTAVTEPSIFHGSGGLILSTIRPVYPALVEKSLLDTGGVLEDVDVLMCWCENGPNDCVYAAKLLQEVVQNPEAKGQRRKARVQKIEGANHFVHWTDPEKAIHLITEWL